MFVMREGGRIDVEQPSKIVVMIDNFTKQRYQSIYFITTRFMLSGQMAEWPSGGSPDGFYIVPSGRWFSP